LKREGREPRAIRGVDDGGVYTERTEPRFAVERLALTRWEGLIEGSHHRWLRWTDLDGHLLRWAEESESERQAEKARADAGRARADALAEHLRALGVESGD
jgi:hypothetical protein